MPSSEGWEWLRSATERPSEARITFQATNNKQLGCSWLSVRFRHKTEVPTGSEIVRLSGERCFNGKSPASGAERVGEQLTEQGFGISHHKRSAVLRGFD
jgi:hypothetical protein